MRKGKPKEKPGKDDDIMQKLIDNVSKIGYIQHTDNAYHFEIEELILHVSWFLKRSRIKVNDVEIDATDSLRKIFTDIMKEFHNQQTIREIREEKRKIRIKLGLAENE